MAWQIGDDFVEGHPYAPINPRSGLETDVCQYQEDEDSAPCLRVAREHANPGASSKAHLINTIPHEYQPSAMLGQHCSFRHGDVWCGYPEADHYASRKPRTSAVVRMADVAQYERQALPEAAKRGIVVSLVDAPADPLGTLAVISSIYEGKVYRSKAEVTHAQRRNAYDAMMATVLSGPLEAIQFTFLIEGVSRAITHQMVRNRFSFFAQESLRFAVPDNWADELPLPPSLAGLPEDNVAVVTYRRAMSAAEARYDRLIALGVPAEEARDVLPHGITTRIYWTVSLRTLLMEAGKRTCTQAQFPWRQLFAGVAKALRGWGDAAYASGDAWQYELFASAIQPVCYTQGKCGFMAKFDRGCTIRGRVDAFAAAGVQSSSWGSDQVTDDGKVLLSISPREWLADPAAARVYSEGSNANG